MYALGVAVTVLAAGAMVAACILKFPGAGPVALLALGILGATTYGIANDMIACRQCIHYFTVGHTEVHKRLLATDNPTLNALAWGIHATWILGTVAGALFAIAAAATKLAVMPVLPYIAAGFAGAIGITLLVSHIFSKWEESKWSGLEQVYTLSLNFSKTIPADPGYHDVNLRDIPVEARAAYMGVAKRNEVGYIMMSIVGVLALAAIITLGCLL